MRNLRHKKKKVICCRSYNEQKSRSKNQDPVLGLMGLEGPFSVMKDGVKFLALLFPSREHVRIHYPVSMCEPI